MIYGMRNPNELELICYAAHIIDLNEYLAVLTVRKAIDKIGNMELDEIILNSMPNVWSK